MFSTSSRASGSRNIAANALRNAGLMDTDTRMRDVEKDKPGGKKVTIKSRRRPRPIESAKEQTLGTQRSVIINTHFFLSPHGYRRLGLLSSALVVHSFPFLHFRPIISKCSPIPRLSSRPELLTPPLRIPFQYVVHHDLHPLDEYEEGIE